MSTAEPSDSGSVQSSQDSAPRKVDKNIMRLAMDPVWKLVIRYTAPILVGSFASAVVTLADYTIMLYYSGIGAVAQEAVFFPVFIVLCMFVPLSFSAASAGVISKSLQAGQFNVANVYLSHFFFMAVIWDILLPIVTLTWYKELIFLISLSPMHSDIDVSFSYTHFIISMTLEPLCYTFALGPAPLLRLEGRGFIGMFRQVSAAVLQLLVTLISFFIANNYQLTNPVTFQGMYNSAIGIIVANGVVGIWMIVVYLRKTIFDVPLRGSLKFSFKRLIPINFKIIGRVLLNGLSMWFQMSQLQILVFIANILYANVFTDPSMMFYKKIAYLNYSRFYGLMMTFNQSFSSGFMSVLGFSLATKKFTRAFHCIVETFCLMSGLTIVMSVIFWALSGPILDSIQPVMHYTARSLQTYDPATGAWTGGAALTPLQLQAMYTQYGTLKEQVREIAFWAFVTPMFLGGNVVATALAQIDQKIWLVTLLQLSKSVPTLILMFVLAFVNGDDANLTLAFPTGDFCAAVVGYIVFVQYLFKYRVYVKFERMAAEGGAKAAAASAAAAVDDAVHDVGGDKALRGAGDAAVDQSNSHGAYEEILDSADERADHMGGSQEK